MRTRVAALVGWVRSRDQGLSALRRAVRTGIFMPALFAVGTKVLHDAELATFAAFGSFAQLLLVDFGGRRPDRVRSQLGLAVAGAVLVCPGTWVSPYDAVAVPAMAVVAFGVLFGAIVSSVLASATTALLLAFILPISLPAGAGTIPDRAAGWLLAGGVAVIANATLWPSAAHDPLRDRAAAACRLLAARLRAGVAFARGEPGATVAARAQAAQDAESQVGQLLDAFYAAPYRPTALSTSARAVVRLVDELGWLAEVLAQAPADRVGAQGIGWVCAVKDAAADVLTDCADALEGGVAVDLDADLDRLRGELAVLEARAASELPRDAEAVSAAVVVTSLEPSFRSQELSFAVSAIAANVQVVVAAEDRRWSDRVLGRQPAGIEGSLVAARRRVASHWDRHSVWLHNSLRGGAALGAAVLIADLTGVQHAFWVILGTLSVLRSNALSTGQNIARSLAGTTVGLVVGGAIVELIGTDTTVLWLLLPVVIVFAGFAPAAISFAAGQAGFTVTLVILYNIIAPTGWRVGLVRVEDIALGCGVSLLVGLLFWPRGASVALRSALADAYTGAGHYLASAVAFGTARCEGPSSSSPVGERLAAAAASRRLDEAFREFLSEGGAKRLPLAEVTRLVTGVAGLRLAADAVLEMWAQDSDDAAGSDRSAARAVVEATAARLDDWYVDLAVGLLTGHDFPVPLPAAGAADELLEAVGRDLLAEDGQPTRTGVRLIWTADHLDAVRRVQPTLIPAARGAQRVPRRRVAA